MNVYTTGERGSCLVTQVYLYAMRRIDCNSIRELQASILILTPPRVLPPPQFPLSPPHRIIPPLSFECLRLRCAFMLFAQIYKRP